jgi:thiamine biosynthesis lipoprotein
MRFDRSQTVAGPALAGALALFTLLLLTSCATSRPEACGRHEFTRPEMGLPFRIVLYAPDRLAAQVAAEAAFARIHELNDVFSDYEYDSELSRLSRTAGSGQRVPVSGDLWRVLERAQALAKRSDGAFDITVGPYVNLWRRARRQKQLPTPAWLERARAAVGDQYLRLDRRDHTAELLVPNMRLDLGAIAKGDAVDAAMTILRERGIRIALVGGAGDMATSGPPPGKKGWRIAVAPLDTPDAPPTRHVLLSHRAIATSGDLSQRLEIDGKRYSHIVDPKTGLGLTHHTLVTVIARDCTTADAMATTVSVLGPERGVALVKGTRGAAVHLVGKPAGKIETEEAGGFARFYEVEANTP